MKSKHQTNTQIDGKNMEKSILKLKRQVTTQIEEEEYKRMTEIRDQTGVTISRQMNLKLKGYKIMRE